MCCFSDSSLPAAVRKSFWIWIMNGLCSRRLQSPFIIHISSVLAVAFVRVETRIRLPGRVLCSERGRGLCVERRSSRRSHVGRYHIRQYPWRRNSRTPGGCLLEGL